jgi:DNA-binding CsgD family transcriptional regulator
MNELVAENARLKEKIAELKDILDHVPAALYINQIDTIGCMETGKNIWANKYTLDFVGYTQTEINEMGCNYFEKIMHPEDLKMTRDSISFLKDIPQEHIFKGISRVKPKEKDYQWCFSQTQVFKYKPDGTPWQFLNAAFVITEPFHTDSQLEDVLKEVNQLKNKLKLQSLSKREREILKLIANGLTDDGISKKLHISTRTVHTHRNKLIKKTATNNTATLVAFAVKSGLM